MKQRGHVNNTDVINKNLKSLTGLYLYKDIFSALFSFLGNRGILKVNMHSMHLELNVN